MRVIKFRAWDFENKVMNFPTIEFNPKYVMQLNCSYMGEFNGKKYDSVKMILMQYTGLKDKNGKEIYEGDVIAIETVRGTIPAWVMDWHSGYGAWRLRDIGKSKASCSPVGLNFWKTHEVIGNIHEHPNLLTSTELIEKK
jgi:hypothetical protein